MRHRRIEVEVLDAAGDEAARGNLADLVWINRHLGGHAVTLKLLRSLRPDQRFTFLDVGAASGDHGRVVMRAFPEATVVSADHAVRNLAGAAKPRVAADAFRMPFGANSFDYVFCSLFLHHFPDDQVSELLAGFHWMARKALIVVDLERHELARLFLPATAWLFQWNAITVADGPTSVQAGFRTEELGRLAQAAGLQRARVRRHLPWFRLSLVVEKCGENGTV